MRSMASTLTRAPASSDTSTCLTESGCPGGRPGRRGHGECAGVVKDELPLVAVDGPVGA